MTGYADPAYAASLAEFGTPLVLPRSGGSLLVRDVPGAAAARDADTASDATDTAARGTDSAVRDAMGPYPLFACTDWDGLAADLDDLRGELVSVALVADPFGAFTAEQLEHAFPGRAAPFKEHFVLDLSGTPLRHVHKHHRRNIARAQEQVEVQWVADPRELLADWITLYEALVTRHRSRGIAAFSPRAFAAQLTVPGMAALRARHDGEVVGATLFYVQGDVAYYHLGAYTELGYDTGASYALFARAVERFASDGLAWLSLGAGAGTNADASDGLSRFKRGWATGTRTAFFCGRILAPERYAALAGAGARATSYFPAYREGEFT